LLEPGSAGMRLDVLLVERGLFASRSRSRDAILRCCVCVEGKIITKSGHDVRADVSIEVRDPAQNLVSRAGLKLLKALDEFSICVVDKVCLDLGVSTGGFSQILLSRGAAHIVAIDVGHGQLHQSLAGDSRISLQEGVNARYLEQHHLQGYQPQLLVCDVSFISLKLALPPALGLMEAGADAIVLIKPQFEAGQAALNGQGIIRDRKIARQIAADMCDWLNNREGWRVCSLIESPIIGGDGNQEFLLHAIKERYL